jgi:pyrroloquinoline-quinone synthase
MTQVLVVEHQLVSAAAIEQAPFDSAMQAIVHRYNFSEHPYFKWMHANTTTREAFLQSQLPFRYAVESFSQSLAAVLARLPSLETRLALLRNIDEEHGYGDASLSHTATFQTYLLSLGASTLDLAQPASDTVLAFSQSALNFCLAQRPQAGASMLGMIEHLYVGISGDIARTIETRAWVQPGSQSHYLNHEVLDIEHAHDLLQIARSEPLSEETMQGLRLGAHYFWLLYLGMYLHMQVSAHAD